MTAPPPTGRIGALPTLPIFFKLQGRRVLLAGGSEPAVWKAELLASAGARVLVCDPSPCTAMALLAEAWGGAIRLEHRAWTSEDLAGVALAIGALDREDGAALQAAARRAGVPVNVVDRPELCDFQFGTIVDRSPLLIAISTDGAAPVFGQALRTRIEALLPINISEWAQAARAWRPAVQALHLGFAARRAFWDAFSARAFDGTLNAPSETDRASFTALAEATATADSGSIDCIGLGSGEAGQVTLEAINALQSADVIIVGHDTDPALTNLGRREAERLIEPDAAALGEIVKKTLQAKRRVAIAATGAPRRCNRWRLRLGVLDALNLSYRAIDGLSCPTCDLTCAARSVVRAQT